MTSKNETPKPAQRPSEHLSPPSVAAEQRVSAVIDSLKQSRDVFNRDVLTSAAKKVEAENTVNPNTPRLSPEISDAAKDFEALALLIVSLKNIFSNDPKKIDELFSTMSPELRSAIDAPQDSDLGNVSDADQHRIADSLKAPEKKEGLSLQQRILQEASSQLGSTAFRGKDVDGGNLACAKVASTILKNCGVLDKVFLGVTATKEALIKKGWKLHSGPPNPGDVVIWNRTKSKSNDGNVVLGYPHIGIVVDEDHAISNSSSMKMPRINDLGYHQKQGVKPEKDYWYNRGVDTFLSPPDTMAA